MTTVDFSSDSLQTADRSGDLLDEERPSGRSAAGLRRLVRPIHALRAIDHLGTYVGILLILLGLTLLLAAWGKTAGIGEVASQVPFLISIGCTGLALVAVGLAVISITAKAEDGRKRREQLRELQSTLAELRRAVEGEVR